MEDKRSTRVLKAWWRLSTKGPRCQTKIGILILICSSLGISNIFWAYSQLLNPHNVALDDGHLVLPLKEEINNARTKHRTLPTALKGGIASGESRFQETAPDKPPAVSSSKNTNAPDKPPAVSSSKNTNAPDRSPAVSSSKKISGDPCRQEVTTTVTLSISEFCLRNATSDFDNLSSQFDTIEQHLAPASLFDDYKDRFTAVIVPNVLCQQKEQIDSSDITLTTQMSTNKVTRLVALAARWNGPVSVAVKVTSMVDLRNFQRLLTEHSEHLQKVAFHLYFESRHRAYPNNILRNVALDQVQSDYFAIFDVDLLPSPMNTHEHLRSTFDNNSKLKAKLDDRTVFVLPAWEITETIADEHITIQHPSYPESREMVIKLDSVENPKERKIEVFRHVFERGHRSTDYYRWISDLKNESYPMMIRDYGYEPYIIGAMKGAPRFFPDFRGYGFNKASYFVELHYARYSFEVLRDFFIFHVNHPASYGDVQKENTRNVNMVCIQYFLDYLAREYGAGYLKKKREVIGLNIWKRRSAQGKHYDRFMRLGGDSEEEKVDE